MIVMLTQTLDIPFHKSYLEAVKYEYIFNLTHAKYIIRLQLPQTVQVKFDVLQHVQPTENIKNEFGKCMSKQVAKPDTHTQHWYYTMTLIT